MQGQTGPGLELLDAQALVGHLVPAETDLLISGR